MSNERPVQTTAPVAALNFGDAAITPAASQPLVPVAQATPIVQATQVRTVITPVTDEQVNQLGQGTEQAMQVISDRILASQRMGDTGDLGKKLNQVIAEAKGLDPATMGHKGFLGKAIGKVLGVKDNLMAQFDTVKGRINTLMGQIGKEIGIQGNRVTDINDLFQANYDFHERLKADQAEGQQLLTTLDAQIEAAKAAAANDTFAGNTLADLQDRRMVLAKRVDNFGRLMLLTEQSAPAIRLMKQNARDLVQTFNDLKQTTMPVWQSVFSQYLISLDQKRGADLANNVADATNEALRRSAEMLGQSSQAIAQARQRSVIDLATLQESQAKLFATLDAVKAIEEKGQADREAAKPQLEALSQALINRFAPAGSR